MIDIEKYLNPSQLSAVTVINGPLLVIAGAGSGKTRVIEYRVLHLVQQDIDPKAILLLTFTRKASREMLSRAASHDPRCSLVEGGTFHSFAYKVLRKYGDRIGLSKTFSILDEDDAQQLIKRCKVKIGIGEKDKKFPKKNTVKNVISASFNKDLSIEQVLAREYSHFLEYTSEIEKIEQEYTRYKKELNCFDYDDLLLFLRMLLHNPEVKGKIAGKYKYVMVDEYQDTNKIQGEIAKGLAGLHNNIMVVGDDAQSIYGFRGAYHENIMNFPKEFAECRVIKLEENYRSTQAILDTADAALENMANKYSKCLVSARNEEGQKPRLMSFRNVYEEAQWIVDKIEELRGLGTNLGEQAVLFRSSHISISLQAELSKRDIPYQVFGGLKFYETAHVKDLTGYLKVIVNPKDEIAWTRVLMQIEGVGAKTAEKILTEIMKFDNLKDILEKVFKKYSLSYKYSRDMAKLRSVLKDIANPEWLIVHQFEIALNYYKDILKTKFDNWPARLNDLESLKNISSKYDSLAELLADFAIESPETNTNDVFAQADDDCLTLSTIHSAKGLEWSTVFLIGLLEGVLPVRFVLDKDDEVEEEHRLFYVAITRAKDHLFMSFYKEGNKGLMSQFNIMSRFLDAPNVMSKLDYSDPSTSWMSANDFDLNQDVDYDNQRLFGGPGRKNRKVH